MLSRARASFLQMKLKDSYFPFNPKSIKNKLLLTHMMTCSINLDPSMNDR